MNYVTVAKVLLFNSSSDRLSRFGVEGESVNCAAIRYKRAVSDFFLAGDLKSVNIIMKAIPVGPIFRILLKQSPGQLIEKLKAAKGAIIPEPLNKLGLARSGCAGDDNFWKHEGI